MNRQGLVNALAPRRALAHLLGASLLAALALAGCSSGGTVTIADSQPQDTQTTDYAIAFVKRSVPTVMNGTTTSMAQDDLRLPRGYFPQADLYLLDPTSAGGAERNITARVTQGASYDIKDVDVAYDGSRIIFAMRGPLTAKQKDFNPPNWSLWEYVVASDLLHQVCPTIDPTCSTAQYVSPHYLPEGRILFATTRQFDSGAVLLDESKPEFEGQTEDLNESAFVLHVMNADGTGLHQVSFNQSHDLPQGVLADGRILFSRWDHSGGNDGFDLYTANPDGTHVQLLYGFGSHDTTSTNPGGATSCPAGEDCTVQFAEARPMPDGRLLALVRPFTDADWGGNLTIIDAQHFTENNQANPDTPGNAGYSPTEVAEQPATGNNVITACMNSCSGGAGNLPLISPGGRFTSAFPLWDGSGRILVTWSECRLQDASGTILPCTSTNLANPALMAAPVLYSAWMFDPSNNTFLPITTPTEGVFVNDIVSLQPRPLPAYLPDSYDSTTPPQGILDIRSVYDWDGAVCTGQSGQSCNLTALGGIAGAARTPADQRPVRFLRITKAVSIPPTQAAKGQEALKLDRNTAFGAAGNYMREILGYVPIEPDGSVRVFVPSDVAFELAVVDAQVSGGNATGYIWRAFPRHEAWLQLLPGEEIDCTGCHVPHGSQRPSAGVSFYSHGNASLFSSIWPGALSAAPFPGTTTGPAACQVGQTMAEALYECGANPPKAAKLSVNVAFTDPWFGGGAGNEPLKLSYDDPTFTTPVPTPLQCAVNGGDGGDDCRVVINYPSTPPMTATVAVPGNIEPLWDKPRDLGGVPGAGTCSTCHNDSTAATGWLNLKDGAAASNPNQENSYQQLLNGFSVTSVDPATMQTIVTPERGPEFLSADAAGSNFFKVFTDPANPAYATHVGLLSPAELRLLSEWVDIGAQYFNNPFNAPTN